MSTRAAMLLGCLALGLARCTCGPTPAAPPSIEEHREGARDDAGHAPRRWLIVGGGPVPSSNEVSIEHDVAAATRAFGEGGRVHFAAGGDGRTVQVTAPQEPVDRLLEQLGDLFSPRGGRRARYRRPTTRVDASARRAAVEGSLVEGLEGPGAPLLVYLAGHGTLGDGPRDNGIALWGDDVLTVADLATLADGHRNRGLRLVATTCFSGGFAELMFRAADPREGVAQPTRCGLFSQVWNAEAAGCDPNPDRSSHEGYGVYLLAALGGVDRAGAPRSWDFDGDGVVSLLDAHTAARVESTAPDVPTTTAERWLREVAPASGPVSAVATPWDDAVVDALGRQLGLVGREEEARRTLDALSDEAENLQLAIDEADQDEQARYREAAATLLARWPVLDDPWHPEFPRLIERERGSLTATLASSDAFRAWRDSRDRLADLGERLWNLRRRAAPYDRLTRALDNRTLAGRLRAGDPEAFETYERLIACENTPP